MTKLDAYSFSGNDLVLGPTQPLVLERTTDGGAPVEQAISRQRMRPGSGSLGLCVSTDGPTRVLQILDIHRQPTLVIRHSSNHISFSILKLSLLSFSVRMRHSMTMPKDSSRPPSWLSQARMPHQKTFKSSSRPNLGLALA